jgi:hypothetical protein
MFGGVANDAEHGRVASEIRVTVATPGMKQAAATREGSGGPSTGAAETLRNNHQTSPYQIFCVSI